MSNVKKQNRQWPVHTLHKHNLFYVLWILQSLFVLLDTMLFKFIISFVIWGDVTTLLCALLCWRWHFWCVGSIKSETWRIFFWFLTLTLTLEFEFVDCCCCWYLPGPSKSILLLRMRILLQSCLLKVKKN